MNSLREMDFISSASSSCSFELLKIQIVCAVGESMNSGRRSSELFCVFSAINGEMALIWPIVHYFYRVSVFPEISQSPPVFLMVLEASFEHWADSLEHSVGVLHISTECLHTEDSLNVFPAGPVNGGLWRLKALASMTPLLLPPWNPFSPAPDALHNSYSANSTIHTQHWVQERALTGWAAQEAPRPAVAQWAASKDQTANLPSVMCSLMTNHLSLSPQAQALKLMLISSSQKQTNLWAHIW